jgi:4-oxalocrotonate tautomerase
VPIVTIQISCERDGSGRDTATAADNAELIRGVSELLLNVHNQPLGSAFVVVEEATLDSWRCGGPSIPVLGRQRRPRLK